MKTEIQFQNGDKTIWNNALKTIQEAIKKANSETLKDKTSITLREVEQIFRDIDIMISAGTLLLIPEPLTVEIGDKTYTFRNLVVGVLGKARKLFLDKKLGELYDFTGNDEKKDEISKAWREFCSMVFVEEYTETRDVFDLNPFEYEAVRDGFFISTSRMKKF